MPVASELSVRINADTGNLERGLSSADRQVSGFARSAGALGAVGTAAFIGLGAAALGLGAGFVGAVGAASSFQATLSQVGAVSGATGSQLQGMTDLALQMGAQTSFSANEAAQAMAELAKGGIAVSDMASVLPGTLNLAAAGGLGLAEAATIATDTMSIFGAQGVTMDQVANSFAGAANISSISVQDMAESMKYVGPVANAMGLSLEDTSAAIALLGANGLKGSQAGTGLRTMLTSLASPSKEAAGLMRDLGLNVFDSGGKIKDMAGISGELKTALAGMTDQQRLSTLETLFGKEGMSAAIAMMGEGENSIESYTDKLKNAATAEATGKAMLDNFAGSMDALKGSVETAAITLGMAFLPVLRQMVDAATGAVNAALPLIQAWGPQLAAGLQAGIAATPGIIATVQAFGSAIAATFGALGSGDFSNVFGPIITAISLAFGPEAAGKVTLFVSSLVTGLQTARDAVVTAKQAFSGDWISADSIATPVRVIGEAFALLGDGVRTVQGFLSGLPAPVLAAAAGFIALGPAVSVVSAVLPLLVGAFAGLGPVIGVLTSTLPLLGSVIAAIGLPIALLIAAVAALGVAWATNFMGIQQAAAGPIAAIGALITGTLIPAVQQGIAFIAPLVAQMGTAFQTAFATISPVLQQIGAGLLAFGASVGPIFATLGGLIVSSLGPAITALVNFGTVIIPQIALAFAHLMQQVGPVLTTMAALITANMTTIQTVMTSAWTIITTMISTAFTVITSLVTAFVQVLSGDFTGAWTTIQTMVGTVWTNIQTMVAAGVTEITAVLSAFAGAIAPLLQSAWDGITSAVGTAWAAITSAVQSGVSTVTSAVGYAWAEIQATAGAAWDGVKNTIITAVQGIVSGMQSGWAAVTSAVQGALDAVRSVVAAVWGSIPEDIRADIALIVAAVTNGFMQKVTIVQTYLSMIQNAVIAGWNFITQAITAALTTVQSAVTSAWSAITSAISSAMSGVQSVVGSAWSAIQSTVASATSAVQSAVSSAWTSVTASTSAAWSQFYSLISNFIGQAVARVRSFGGEVASALGSIAGMAASAAAQIGSAIISGISGALRAGAGALASIAGDVVRGALDAAKGALGIRSPSKEFAYVGKMAIQGLIEGMDDKKLDAMKKAADVASAVSKAAMDALAAGTAIASFDFAKNSPSGDQLGWLSHLVTSLVATIQDAAQQFTTEGLKSASEFADAAGKVGGGIKNAIDGILALGKANFANGSPSGETMGWFAHLATSIVAVMQDAATRFSSEGLQAAGSFSDAASKVGGGIKNALDGISALANYNFATGSPDGAAMGWFAHLVSSVVATIQAVAVKFNTEGLKATSEFSDAAGKVLGVLKIGTEGFKALTELVPPSKGAVDAFLAMALYVVNRFGEMALTLSTEGIAKTTAFANAAKLTLEATKSGTDAFKAFEKLVVPSQEAIDNLLAGVRYVIERFGQMGTELGAGGIQRAQAFATAAQGVFTTLKSAIDLMGSLKTFKDDATKAFDALLSGMQDAIDKAQANVSLAKGLKLEAEEYLANMEAAARAFAQGASLGGVPSGLPSAVGGLPASWGGGAASIPKLAAGGIVTKPTLALVGERGPEAVVPLAQYNGGGGGGTTINVTITAPVYGVAHLQDVVVEAVSTAQRRGRL